MPYWSSFGKRAKPELLQQSPCSKNGHYMGGKNRPKLPWMEEDADKSAVMAPACRLQLSPGIFDKCFSRSAILAVPEVVFCGRGGAGKMHNHADGRQERLHKRGP